MSHFGPIYSSVNIVRLSKYHKYSSHDSEIALSSRKSYFFLFRLQIFFMRQICGPEWQKPSYSALPSPLYPYFVHVKDAEQVYK